MLKKHRLWLCACLLLVLVLIGAGCGNEGVNNALDGTTESELSPEAPGSSEEESTLVTTVDRAENTDTESVAGGTDETTVPPSDAESEKETDPPHSHTEATVPGRAATCTEAGLTDGTKCVTCGDVLQEQSAIPAAGHTEATVPGRAATCTEAGLTDGTKCVTCGDILQEQSAIPAAGHTEATVPGRAATCTEAGLTDGTKCVTCGDVLQEQSAIPAAGHTEAAVPGRAATCTEAGLTDGCVCSVCAVILSEQMVLEARGHTPTELDVILPTYESDGTVGGNYCLECRTVLNAVGSLPAYRHSNGTHGRNALAASSNAEALLQLYDRLETIAVAFHEDYERQIDGDQLIIGSANFTDLGLMLEDAFMVWNMYKADRPIFYWIDTSVGYNNDAIFLLTSEHYGDGDVRAACDALIYQAIYDMAPNTDSPYEIAYLYHDAILYGMDYAYEADGVTPEDALWAHNIMGFFEKGSGVCESYARTLQLLLNYYGVENYFVTGEAGGGGHAWNLIRLDDGKWYWIDLTWDDRPKADEGTPLDYTYDFFCINDTEGVRFLTTHTPDTPNGTGFYFQYELPARAKRSYVPKKNAA